MLRGPECTSFLENSFVVTLIYLVEVMPLSSYWETATLTKSKWHNQDMMLGGEVFSLWSKWFKTPSLPWFLWRLLLVHLSLFLSSEGSFRYFLPILISFYFKDINNGIQIFIIDLYLTILNLKRQLENTQRTRPRKWPSNNFTFRTWSWHVLLSFECSPFPVFFLFGIPSLILWPLAVIYFENTRQNLRTNSRIIIEAMWFFKEFACDFNLHENKLPIKK